QRDTGERQQRRRPEADAQLFEARTAGEDRREDRQRPEEQRNGRRRRELQRVDEAELVREQQGRADDHERQLRASDPQRAFPGERDRDEDQRRAAVPNGRVGERLEALVEDVLRNREV